jgi:hypothetical protein
MDLSKKITVVFCIPGNSFSGKFLECWSKLLGYCFLNGIEPVVSRDYSCNIYYVRNLCLGGDVMRGPQQKPFNGKIDYDYIMWIDSDILFTPDQFKALLDHDLDIVSGLYLMEGGNAYATVKEWDEEYFLQNGTFRFLTPEELTLTHGVVEAAYTGMGFMLVKRGIFESIEYPWFKPIEKKIGGLVDFTMEDVSFCLRSKEAGYKISIDPNIIVHHQKTCIL